MMGTFGIFSNDGQRTFGIIFSTFLCTCCGTYGILVDGDVELPGAL